MNRKIPRILICILLLILLPVKISYANSINTQYIDIRLTKPIVQNNVINLGSDSGFFTI